MAIEYQLTLRPLVAVVSQVTSNFKCDRLPLQSSYCNKISIIRKKIKSSIRVRFFYIIFSHDSPLFGPKTVQKRAVFLSIVFTV